MPVWFALSVISLFLSLSWLGEHPMWGAMSLGLLGGGAWWAGQRLWSGMPKLDLPKTSGVTPADINAKLQACELWNTTLKELQAPKDFDLPLASLHQAKGRQSLEIGIWGNLGSHPAQLEVQISPHLGPNTQIKCLQVPHHPPQADLILFLINGDLTQTELQALRVLKSEQYPVLLVWLQSPQESLANQGLIAAELTRKLKSLLSQEDWVILKPGQWQPLISRLAQIETQDRQRLIHQRTFSAAQKLEEQIREQVKQLRQTLSLPIITRYQWLGAGVAAVNPIPLLDLVVTGGLLVQLTLELGKLYQRDFEVTQARPLAETLLQQMLQLGAVEVSTQALGHWLKGNSFTYLAGSCVQGASVAYVIRVGGLSLIDYWQTLADQPQRQAHGRPQLQASVQRVLAQLPRQTFFRQFQFPNPPIHPAT